MIEELKQLRDFTKACRSDMHEPDEQGIKARIVGDHLDNACGNHIVTDAIINGYQEFVVILENDKGESHLINLATLIALARRDQ